MNKFPLSRLLQAPPTNSFLIVQGRVVHRRAERQRGRASHAEGRHRREAAPRRSQADPELGKMTI